MVGPDEPERRRTGDRREGDAARPRSETSRLRETGTAARRGIDQRCSACDSADLEYVEGMYQTGVYSPDGGAEWRLQRGVRCRSCGTVEGI